MRRERRMIPAALLAACVLLLPLAARADDAAPAAAAQSWMKTELYFGLEKPDGIRLAPQDWVTFVLEIVTPRLKDGFTILDAYGQWTDPAGQLIKQPSKLLIVLHPDTPQFNDAIEQIRAEYRKRYGVQSVLRVDSPAKASF